MSHKRTDIRTALVALLTGTSPTYATSAQANVFSNRVRNISEAKLPAINILDQPETATPRDIRSALYIRTWTIKIDLIIESTNNYDSDLDDICLEIETLINSDRTLGGLCITINYLGTEPEYDDSGQKTIGHASMNYEIKYIA